jgi:hypothetical protein
VSGGLGFAVSLFGFTIGLDKLTPYVYLTAYVYTVYEKGTSMNWLMDDTACARHEERIARSLQTYRTRGPRGQRARRLRPDPCPLIALAQWLTARLRPAAPVHQ